MAALIRPRDFSTMGFDYEGVAGGLWLCTPQPGLGVSVAIINVNGTRLDFGEAGACYSVQPFPCVPCETMDDFLRNIYADAIVYHTTPMTETLRHWDETLPLTHTPEMLAVAAAVHHAARVYSNNRDLHVDGKHRPYKSTRRAQHSEALA